MLLYQLRMALRGLRRDRGLWLPALAGLALATSIWTARFVDADFFPMFGVPVGAGRAFSREEEASGAAVLVVAVDRETGSAARSVVGRTLLVDGRPFRVVGGVSADQPVRPDWDISA